VELSPHARPHPAAAVICAGDRSCLWYGNSIDYVGIDKYSKCQNNLIDTTFEHYNEDIMVYTNPLRSINRFITTHNAKGQAVFSETIAPEAERKAVDGEVAFALPYCTGDYPADLNDDKDIKTYQEYLQSPPGLVISNGTVLRQVDIPPGSLSPMHRTVSLDYGIVMNGTIELVLDSGETRMMAVGDIAIQRGTMHAWRNTSETEWARMLYVLQPCKPLTIGDETMGEDLETMQGVRAST
jgi:quercetin dioxygenase-like cupin family protein